MECVSFSLPQTTLIVINCIRNCNNSILASNRDEFTDRPTINASFHSDDFILSGLDELKGGTWLGINRNGWCLFNEKAHLLH